jgi:hypothetical protein
VEDERRAAHAAHRLKLKLKKKKKAGVNEASVAKTKAREQKEQTEQKEKEEKKEKKEKKPRGAVPEGDPFKTPPTRTSASDDELSSESEGEDADKDAARCERVQATVVRTRSLAGIACAVGPLDAALTADVVALKSALSRHGIRNAPAVLVLRSSSHLSPPAPLLISACRTAWW